MSLTPTSIQRIVSSRFYYGVFSWAGKDVIGSHTPIVNKELYDKANSIGK
ncbi:recombinase family protein [Motiliproteus sp. MSK22-1]